MLAYDAATSTVVLFGGYASTTTPCAATTHFVEQTWTWG